MVLFMDDGLVEVGVGLLVEDVEVKLRAGDAAGASVRSRDASLVVKVLGGFCLERVTIGH